LGSSRRSATERHRSGQYNGQSSAHSR
jgi:hypothetical protein